LIAIALSAVGTKPPIWDVLATVATGANPDMARAFPPGLYLLDYLPGVRFKIREQLPTTLFDGTLTDYVSGLFFIVANYFVLFTVLGFSLMTLTIISPLAIWFWAREKLRGKVVKINIRNRTYFGSSGGGGGWPPTIRSVTNVDPSTGKWKTSLYLNEVNIWSVLTETSEGGRTTLEPFLNALQKLSALRRTKKLTCFEMLSDLFY